MKIKMRGRTRIVGALKAAVSKTSVQWLMAIVMFFAASLLYMGPAITSCRDTSTALFSDSSGGMGWNQWAGGNKINWGYTYQANYPIGEQLEKPQYITSQVLYAPYRFFSWLTTPTCGLNLVVLLGYMSAALAMFGLVRWLFKRGSVALFAGYAVAFVPYHEIKAQSHVTYVNNAVFIGIIWAYLWFLQKPSYRRISLVALLAATAMYIDGYFVLLSAALVAILLLLTLLRGPQITKQNHGVVASIRQYGYAVAHNARKFIKQYLVLGFLTLILSLPIISYELRHGSEIQQSLTDARGQIALEAAVYSARPAEYLLPSYDNSLIPESYRRWRLAHQHGSNPSETTLYLGISVVSLAGLALAFLFKPQIRRTRLTTNITYAFLVGLTTAAVVLGFLLSLPPRLSLAGYSLLTPTDALIHLTSFWRVFARFFLMIDPLVVLLAAAALYALLTRTSRRRGIILVLVCFIVLFLEFLPSPMRHVSNLYKSAPKIYQVLAKDSSVHVVAEYPITDLGYSPLTFTFQQVSQKHLVNPNDVTIVKGPFMQSIAGLNDPQTLGVLKAEGVDVLISAGHKLSAQAMLDQYYPVDNSGAGLGVPPLYSYSLKTVVSRQVVLAPAGGFDAANLDEQQISHHKLRTKGVLKVLKTSNRQPAKGDYRADFDVTSLSGKPEKLTLGQKGKTIWSGFVTSERTHISISVIGSEDVRLSATAILDITNLQAAPY